MSMLLYKHRKIFTFFSQRFLSFLPSIKCYDLVPPNKDTDLSTECSFENIHRKYKLLLDVRSPAEFLIDHLPGAINIPILNNIERSEVGKIYNKSNPVAARFLGSSLIMKNLSQYLQPGGILFNALIERIKNDDDHIMIYCWRGGQRSRSVAIVLSEIGFTKKPIHVLSGGYRAYRKQVIADLETLPNEITFIGICGFTGTAKTKILHCLESLGETVLNLEDLAEHKGSVFGAYVHNIDKTDEKITISQPSQKKFDSRLRTELAKICRSQDVKRCRNNKPIVWVECESRNIGSISLSNSLWNQMQISKRIIIEASIKERVKHILSDYIYWTDSHYLPVTIEMINWLSKSQSQKNIDCWISMAKNGDFEKLVESLLFNHYDVIYRKNRQSFISCTDTNLVVKVFSESLDEDYIRRNLCLKLIDLSKTLYE